jgi:hypothetical protein
LWNIEVWDSVGWMDGWTCCHNSSQVLPEQDVQKDIS